MSAKRQADETGPGPKKQRFDTLNPSTLAFDEADDEDAILELDEIGKGKGRQLKRTGVRLDGYDSDSSTENFDARAEAKEKAESMPLKKSQDEDDNDMFADVDQDMADGDGVDTADHAEPGGRKGTKQVQFMEPADIAGQIDESHSGGHVKVDFGPGAQNEKGKQTRDVESSSESGDDSDRAALDPELEDADELGAGSKKRHAPKLDAFNLKRETEEEGLFDESGNFVRKAADADAKHDTWMAGLNKRDLKKAKEAHDKREEALKRSHAENDSVLSSDLLAKLIANISRTETPLEALQRLGSSKSRKKQQPAWKKKKAKKADAMDVDGQDEESANGTEDPAETQRKLAVEAITDSADKLLSRGQVDIYDTVRELLVRQYKRETGEDWKEPVESVAADQSSATVAGKQWEYRWADARDGGQRHGPYDGHMMDAWVKAGYFGEDVEYRAVGDTGWKRDVDFI